MKHTNLYDKIEKIRRQEVAGLIAAVNAHGGKFEWPADKDMERPIIAINPDNCCPAPADVELTCVCVNSGRLELAGVDKNDGDEISFTPDEVFTGHLSSIIDYIPETEAVSDVSQKEESFKITSVSEDKWDFENPPGINQQIHVLTVRGIDQIRQQIKEKGNIDFGKDCTWCAVYINDDGYAECPYFQGVELEADGKLSVLLSDGRRLYEDGLTTVHVMDLLTLLFEGHRKNTK